jgi:hypothetical protein
MWGHILQCSTSSQLVRRGQAGRRWRSARPGNPRRKDKGQVFNVSVSVHGRALSPFGAGLTALSLLQLPGTDDTADREAVQAEVIRGLPLAETPLEGGAAGGLVPPGPVLA